MIEVINSLLQSSSLIAKIGISIVAFLLLFLPIAIIPVLALFKVIGWAMGQSTEWLNFSFMEWLKLVGMGIISVYLGYGLQNVVDELHKYEDEKEKKEIQERVRRALRED